MAQAKIELDHSVGLEKELAATKQDIDDRSLAITSMQAVTQVLRQLPPPDRRRIRGTNPSLRITRRLADGFTVIPATAMTSLFPGTLFRSMPTIGSKPRWLRTPNPYRIDGG